MVKLYTWGATTPESVMEHNVAPDVGHAALEVLDEDGIASAYASFWPERDSLIGRVTSLLGKHRPARNPDSYAQEIDPEGGYMQRPADRADVFEGLDKDRVVGLWQDLRESEYDFLKWNCASVCKLLLLSAMPTRLHHAIEQAMGVAPEDLARLSSADDLSEKLKALSLSSFIDSHPEELQKMAEAYLAANGIAVPEDGADTTASLTHET